jgi:hypothetical protein
VIIVCNVAASRSSCTVDGVGVAELVANEGTLFDEEDDPLSFDPRFAESANLSVLMRSKTLLAKSTASREKLPPSSTYFVRERWEEDEDEEEEDPPTIFIP